MSKTHQYLRVWEVKVSSVIGPLYVTVGAKTIPDALSCAEAYIAAEDGDEAPEVIVSIRQVELAYSKQLDDTPRVLHHRRA